MTGRTFDGSPLTPGVNVDPVNLDAGIAEAKLIGYDDAVAVMVATYALQRHARGEEDGAERTWLAEYPSDFTSWRRILAAAVATARHCHAGGQGPCLAVDCPIAGQRPRACPGAAGPQHPAESRTP